MEKIDKAIEILQAYKEGKTIEYYVNYTDSWEEVKPNENIISKILIYSDLRIKHTPKYRPYANAEEFLKDSKEHGPYIGDGAKLFTAKEIGGNYIESSAEDLRLNFTELWLDSYKWQDGHLCAVSE